MSLDGNRLVLSSRATGRGQGENLGFRTRWLRAGQWEEAGLGLHPVSSGTRGAASSNGGPGDRFTSVDGAVPCGWPWKLP